MPFDAITPELHLPFSSDEVFSPDGAGAKVYADLANEKIGRVIERDKGVKPKVGILVANPKAKETQQIIGIICEFKNKIDQNVIDLAHKLCWNFCRSPLLIVIEPTLIRVFSCYEKPKEKTVDLGKLPFETEPEFSAPKPIHEFNPKEILSDDTRKAIKALQWVELVSGNFFKEEKDRFPREQKADETLLKNLSIIRQKLHKKGLEYDTIHDLLARIIFIQFLFDRKDSQGKSIISSEYLEQLYKENKLSKEHKNLEEILNNYDDAYKFFKLLNKRFNGDLFPGNEEKDWQDEMSKVTEDHLKLLADFIEGKLELESGQFSLWKMYSFDTIPLEFISSIYEEFVSQQQHQEKAGDSKKPDSKREKGVYYTKSHLVDFILDNVLPWDDDVWDLKILDPSCGSGIFLVKAFQRLVHRWENSLSEKEKVKSAEFSKRKKEKVIEILEKNLFGVDIDEHAVRVASFSLYLALCDELDPRTLWQEVKFPDLRNEQVVERDFFSDDSSNPLFRQFPDIKYDLIIGNAPWGRETVKTSDEVKKWAKSEGWDIAYGNIGPLFLPKAASLAKPNAYISFVQPALMLTAQTGTAKRFRRRFFGEFKVEEIVNLSDLKNFLFEKAKYPACVITMRPIKPDEQPIQYICPKKRGTDEDWRQITIEPMDVSFVLAEEAINDPWIWTVLMFGNRRDFHFIKRLSLKNNVLKMERNQKAKTRQGIIAGNKKNILQNKRFLQPSTLPENAFLTIDINEIPKIREIKYHSRDSSDFDSFEYPQSVIKHSHQKKNNRFVSYLVESELKKGALCSRDFLNLHSENLTFLKSATLTFNSSFAAYYLLLTDGSFAFFHPKPLVDSFWKVPVPDIPEKEFDVLKNLEKNDETLAEIDKLILKSLNISESEKILVEDLFDFTMPDYFAGKKISEGREATKRNSETELKKYCNTFFKVISAGFGKDKNLRATIFQESEDKLPVRMIAIYLDFPNREELINVDIQSNEKLSELLQELNEKFIQNQSENGNIFYQRVVRIYSNDEGIPTIYIVKPDQKRYWLRSQALHDADEVSADIVSWFQQQNQINSQGAKRKKVA